MRSRRKSSLNISSLNIDELPIKRIVLVAILAYILIAFIYFVLTVYRMLVVPYGFLEVCNDIGPELLEFCLNEVIQLAQHGLGWSCIKFSAYVVIITPLFYLLLAKQKGSIVSTQLSLSLILLMLVTATIETKWAEQAAILISCLLAGCFIKRRRDKLTLS
jgi:hypothetical protein